MAKKTDPAKYLVQAYQSPYNQKLFSMDNKTEFEAHLRQEARIERDRAAAASAKAERLQLWTQLRESATCLDDVPKLLQGLPDSLEAYYNKTAFFKSRGEPGWSLTLHGKTTLGMECITHASPLGQPTNWGGQDKEGPVYLLGLRGQAVENLNYKFSEAKRESGIEATNNTFVLFADDWPFVAKMALLATFDKTIKLPEKYAYQSGAYTDKVKPEYTRFWDDIKRYSMAYTGMAYAELQGMRDSLGLSRSDLEAMMASYAVHKHNAPQTAMALPLPDGMDDESEMSTPGFGV